MAIKIESLETLAKQVQQKRYIYKDLFLDIRKQQAYNTITEKNISKNDLEANFDLEAIIWSLRNLFTTKPGQRFLFPKYGLDLRRFLFEPINEMTARDIGEAISQAIRNYEPRVYLQNVDVVGRPDENIYDITITIELPVFKSNSSINMVLDVKTEKFVYVNTKR